MPTCCAGDFNFIFINSHVPQVLQAAGRHGGTVHLISGRRDSQAQPSMRSRLQQHSAVPVVANWTCMPETDVFV